MTTPEPPPLRFEVGGAGWKRARRHLAAAGYRLTPSGSVSGRAVFWDTADGRLGRQGLRLLLWEEREAWRLVLVHPSGREEDLARGMGKAPFGPVLDPASWEVPAGRGGLLGAKPLVPLAAAHLRIRSFTLRSPTGRPLRAEVQAPAPREGGGVPSLLQVAAASAEGAASLGHLEVLLRDRAGLKPAEGDLASQLRRGQGPGDPSREARAESPLRPEEPLSAAGRRLLGRQLSRLEANVPWALGDLHPEFVHDARVAARRARTLLRLLGPALGPRRSESLRAELRWAAGLLGEVRDLDVFLAAWDRQAARLPPGLPGPDTLRAVVAGERAGALEALREGLSSRRFHRLLQRIRRLVLSPPPSRPRGAAAERTSEAARRLVRRTGKRALAAAEALGPDPAPEALHRLRILFKRARYAAEFFREVLPQEAEDLIAAAVDLQEALGAHQDAVVAAVRLRRAVEAGRAPEGELLAAGALLQGFWQSAAAARADLGERLGRFRKAYRKLRRSPPPSPETSGTAPP
ncbi:MAG: CHAD domain-containing protein [Acidobacteriota bacterium]